MSTPTFDPAAHAGFDPALRIDWIDASRFADGRPGRLGLTILPGKTGASQRYPGRTYARDTDADLSALQAAGVGVLVLLVEDHELRRWGSTDIVVRGADIGLDVVRFPTPDGHPPARQDMDRILAAIAAGREQHDVAVACMGGVGRTGTVAACALVQAGLSADEAIAAVRRIRHPSAVETIAQERFVAAFAGSDA